MNDRQRIELLFFPLAFKSILESGGRQDDGYRACIQALDAAAAEILRPEDMKRRAQIMRRAFRMHDMAFDPDRKGGVRVEKIALETYELLQAVLEAGALELVEGTPLAVAVGAIVDAFADQFGEPALVKSAKKQAAKALAKLHREGLFEGVKMAEAA